MTVDLTRLRPGDGVVFRAFPGRPLEVIKTSTVNYGIQEIVFPDKMKSCHFINGVMFTQYACPFDIVEIIPDRREKTAEERIAEAVKYINRECYLTSSERARILAILEGKT